MSVVRCREIQALGDRIRRRPVNLLLPIFVVNTIPSHVAVNPYIASSCCAFGLKKLPLVDRCDSLTGTYFSAPALFIGWVSLSSFTIDDIS